MIRPYLVYHYPVNNFTCGLPCKLTRFVFWVDVTIFYYLAVAVVELEYFETCGFHLLRHNDNYVLRT